MKVYLVYDGDIAESDVAAVCATREVAERWAGEHPEELHHWTETRLNNPIIVEMEVIE